MFIKEKKFAALFLLPLLAFLALAPFLSTWDFELATHFFKDGQFSSKECSLFFKYGPSLAIITALGGLIAFIGSFAVHALKKWRKPGLLLALTLLIGSGLLVHLLFKDQWGRPRPRQVIEFGGNQQFRPFYEPNIFHQPEPSKSFPCGHASTGFYFLVFYLLGLRLHNKKLAIFGLVFGLFFGSFLGYMRMLQGGHFLSDVIVSGLIMWWSALLIDRLIYGPMESK